MIPELLQHPVAVADSTTGLVTPLLPEEDQALGSVVARRRADFTLGRACAHRALDQLGVEPAPLLAGQHREPVWPAGVVGSITHCPGYGAAAVARRGERHSLGIDAEVHEPLPAGLLRSVASPAEAEQLADLPPGTCWDRLLFSAKESVYKTWFPLMRCWLGFHDVHVSFDAAGGTFAVEFLTEPMKVGDTAVRRCVGRFHVGERWLASALELPVNPDREDVSCSGT